MVKSAVFGNKSYLFAPVKYNGFFLQDKNNRKIFNLTGSNLLGNINVEIENIIIKKLQDGNLQQNSIFYSKEEELLSNKLCKLADFIERKIGNEEEINGKVFFSNSRQDIIDLAIKIAKERYNKLCDRDYSEILVIGSNILKKQKIQGFKFINSNDIDEIEFEIDENISAILINTLYTNCSIADGYTKEFFIKLRELCNKHEILLIYDETNYGFGRSGKVFTYKHYGISPDIICTSQIANNIDFYTCIIQEKYANYLLQNNKNSPKEQFITNNINLLAISVANIVIDKINNINFLCNIKENSDFLWQELSFLSEKYKGIIRKVFVFGMFASIQFYEKDDNERISQILLSNGMAVLQGFNNTILLYLQLDINKNQIQQIIEILDISISEIDIIERY